MTRRVLVTGIAGGLARLVALRLAERGDELVGVDYRESGPLPASLAGMRVYRANYNKTAIEDIFDRHQPTHVLHLGRVGNLRESAGKRFALNVVGSQKLHKLSVDYGVSRMIVLSTFHIYGAHPSNHIPIVEDEPLRAGLEFPELADAIQLDNMASTWVWRYPEVSTAVLRPCHVVGPHLRNTISVLLREPRIPRLFGFDPMMQFLYEDDLADAIVKSLDGSARGLFNVAGRGAIPWSTAVELSGARSFVVPSSMASVAVRLFSTLPEYLVNFFKFPCVIGDEHFRSEFAWEPTTSLRDTVQRTVRGT